MSRSRPESQNQSRRLNDTTCPTDDEALFDTAPVAIDEKNMEPAPLDGAKNCNEKGKLPSLSLSTNIKISSIEKTEVLPPLSVKNNIDTSMMTVPNINHIRTSASPNNNDIDTGAITVPHDSGIVNNMTLPHNSDGTVTVPKNTIGIMNVPHLNETTISTTNSKVTVKTTNPPNNRAVSPNGTYRTLIVTNNLTLTNLSKIENLMSLNNNIGNDDEIMSPIFSIRNNEALTSGIHSADNTNHLTHENDSTQSLLNNTSNDDYFIPSTHFGGSTSQFNERFETRELWNFHSLLNFLGDAVSHVKEVLREQFRSFVQECREDDNPTISENRFKSFPSHQTDEDNLRYKRKPAVNMSEGGLMMTERIANSEETSKYCSRCCQLLTKDVRSLQNEVNEMKNQLLAQDDTKSSKEHVSINYLEELVPYLVGIKQDQSQITRYLQDIQKNQESLIKTQEGHNGRRNNNNENEGGHSSRPN